LLLDQALRDHFVPEAEVDRVRDLVRILERVDVVQSYNGILIETWFVSERGTMSCPSSSPSSSRQRRHRVRRESVSSATVGGIKSPSPSSGGLVVSVESDTPGVSDSPMRRPLRS
jgi:hypothetical protein